MRMSKGMAEPKRSFGPAGAERCSRAKRAVNVSVDTELLNVAKEMKINLSQVLERALRELTAEERAQRFYTQHRSAIDSYNSFVESRGTLAEAFYGPDAISHDDPAV
jgi:antitoxin CcdA